MESGGVGGTSPAEEAQLDLARHLPKVELHAHLNGCIRESTLFELANERGIKLNEHHFAKEPDPGDDHSMYNVRPRSLGDCFEMFSEITKCVDDLAALSRITSEALEDFAEQHVAYLELRSTPKKLLIKTGTNEMATKRDYCKTVLECMQEFEKKEEQRYTSETTSRDRLSRLPMVCRFIVAVDRSQPLADAREHVQLAETLTREFGGLVVGVDLGGNPTKSHFNDFRETFEQARRAGLLITLHCGEVPCGAEESEAYAEASAILGFAPERLGHALLLPPSLQRVLIESKIPVESCPTSNVMTLELAKHHSGSLLEGLKTHPQLDNWIRQGHPFSIGTDDPGVFNTNATKELMLIQKAFDLGISRVRKIPLDSMNHSFCDGETRKLVKARIQERIEQLSKGL